jgi:hypothetical protein
MLNLNNVTLVCVATTNVQPSLKALEHSLNLVSFKETLFFTHENIFCPSNIKLKIIKKFNSIDEWSFFIIYKLHEFIKTEYILLIHYDGYVVNPDSWKDVFLNYDYIGAPWPVVNDEVTYKDVEGNTVRVGNSVSLRSKRILELPSKLNLKWEPFHGFYNEDGFLCCKNKIKLEKNGIKFADIEVAKYFSHETMIPEIKGIKPFVFHKFFGTNSVYKNFIPLQKRILNKIKKLI